MKKGMSTIITIFMVLSISITMFNDPDKSSAKAKTEIKYTLELGRWGIYNDGTHSNETTKGINNALQWASENGYEKFLYRTEPI